MHIISKRLFAEAADRFPNDRAAIMDVYNVLRRASSSSPHEMRRVFPSLDNFKHRNRWWVIDIGGHNLRLIGAIQFVHQRIYDKHIVTHAEYDKLSKKYAQGAL